MPGKKKTIGYIGWLGHGNLGDELIYYLTKRFFKPFNLLEFKIGEKVALAESFLGRKLFGAVCL
ncbi:MAG: hypothetical protein PHV55_08280, partial [Candidatus Omnitrophica bacterium]|nr:hypothetical protein [Candidatus Omnitrophota bacterium]